jgi:hypothetical protein
MILTSTSRFLAGLALAAVFPAAPAGAQAQSCTITEVAPGVKMRSAPCSNPFGSPFAPPTTVHRQEAMPAGVRSSTFRYGETEIRMGGGVRYDYQAGRR